MNCVGYNNLVGKYTYLIIIIKKKQHLSVASTIILQCESDFCKRFNTTKIVAFN